MPRCRSARPSCRKCSTRRPTCCARHAELVAGLGLGPADSERLTRQLVVYNGLLAQMLRDPYEEAIDEAEATARVLVAAALA